MRLTALHGFLGRPDDWTTLFHGHALQNQLQAEDLFAEDIVDLNLWAERFNYRQASTDSKALLGYSLGGRLTLHALISNPEQWSSAVIVSAHLGLSTPEEKAQRREIDEEWACRFEGSSWSQLMNDWNSREVFRQDSFSFMRNEKNYSRTTLAAVLRKWSLSQQSHLHKEVSQLKMPILWIVGENDIIYAQQASQVRLCHPLSEIWIVPAAGHRVPWQYPEQFLLKITQFLDIVQGALNT